MTLMVTSRIARVEVYRVGAKVTRHITMDASDGIPESIEIPGLPLALEDATVRVDVHEQPQGLDVVTRDLRVGLHAPPRQELEDVPEQAEVKQLERRAKRLELRKAHLDAERSLLEQVKVPGRPKGRADRPPPASPMAARVAVEAFVDEEVGKRLGERRELETELEQVMDDLMDARDRLRRASDARRIESHEITKSVVATLSAAGYADGEVTLSLQYYVPGARWAPAYQCKIARDGEDAVIQMRALVCQRTGEDWSGVELELSTAAPTQFVELPKLSSIRIGKAQPPAPSSPGFRPAPRGAASLFQDFDVAKQRASATTPSAPVTSMPMLPVAPLKSLMAQALEPARMAVYAKASAETGYDDALDGFGDYDEIEEEYDEPSRSMSLEDMMVGGAAEQSVMASRSTPPPAPQAAYAAPGAPPAPAPARDAKRKSKRARRGVDGGGGAPERSTFGGRSEGSVRAVLFAELRLDAADATSTRNALRPVDRRSRYMETLGRAGLPPKTDVMQLVAEAFNRAAAVANSSLPTGAGSVASAAGVFDYTYVADHPVDVPSDGVFHSVPLGDRETTCVLTYVTVPREAPHVFRIAKLENPTSAPMLQGPAELYVDDEYVLTTQLPTVSPKQRFELGLGVEQAIKCARNTSFTEQRSGGGVVAMAELWHALDVRIANNLGREVSCEVRERIPQPAEGAEVVVEEGTIEPAWSEYEQKERGRPVKGGRRWVVDIPAGEEVALSAEYIVKIYAQNELVGGNRREQ